MNVEIGQYLNDGYTDLLVCEKGYYKDKYYVFLLNEELDEAFFCELVQFNDGWNFVKVKDPEIAQILTIHFSGIREKIKEGYDEGI